MASITGRLLDLVKVSGFRSRRAFAQAAGINEITFNDNLAKGAEPRFSTLESILKAFPNVSSEWLMRGEGYMFRTGEKPENVIQTDKPTRTVAGDNNSENTYTTLIEQLRKENVSLQEQLREKGEQLKVKDEQIRNKDTQMASLLSILDKQPH